MTKPPYSPGTMLAITIAAPFNSAQVNSSAKAPERMPIRAFSVSS